MSTKQRKTLEAKGVSVSQGSNPIDVIFKRAIKVTSGVTGKNEAEKNIYGDAEGEASQECGGDAVPLYD